MDGAEGEPSGSHVGGAPPEVPDAVPMETALDCSALKTLSPAQLQGYLLASPPLGGTNKREELDLADVVYMDGDGLSLPLVSPGGAVNCSILMSYLRKHEEPADKAASPYKKPSPEPAPAVGSDAAPAGAAAAATPAEATRDLSQTCLVCGVAASGRGSRRLSDSDPLPASGGRLLPFVGRLLAEQLEAGALAQLRLVCLDCHDLLVTIDDLEQRVEAMRNSVRSQFRAWWLAEAVPAGGEQRRRSTRRAAGRLAAAGHDSVQTAGGPVDDEYLPTKQRKHRTANSTGKSRPGARSRTVTTSVESSKNLICSQCPFDTFDREALRGHIAAVHNGEKVHQCEVCQKRFTYEDSLKRHMNLHQHYIKEFRCEPCGEQFVKRADLLLHRQLYLHGAQASSPPPPPAAANPADGDVGDFAIQFCCPSCAQSHTLRDDEKDLVVMCACGRQFDLAGALRLFPGRYRRSCLACRQDCADHNAMERHLTDSHGGGEVICLLCGCRYLRLDHFKLHALFHSTLRELACDTCEFRTFNPSHLASHSHPWSLEAGAANPGSQEAIVAAVRKHSVGRRGRPRKDTKPVPPDTMCPICNKELTSLTNLKNHMVLHSDVHAHTCTVCGRKFKLRKYLTTHLALHTGVRQFKCTLCEKEFNQKCELNRHMRYHNGEMKHVCEFCGKRFREANGLKFHRQVHTGERPFACGQCGIALRSAAKLRIHQRKHTGEKPYTCEYCGRDFAYKYNFDCHLRLHTGERRFRCSVCNSGFERRDKLHAHEQQCAKRTDAAPAALPPPPQQPAPPSPSPPLPSLPPHRHPSPPQPPHPPPQLHPPPPSLPAVAPIPAPPAPLSAAPPPTPPAPPTEPPQPRTGPRPVLLGRASHPMPSRRPSRHIIGGTTAWRQTGWGQAGRRAKP